MTVTIKPSPELAGRNKDAMVKSNRELLTLTSKTWVGSDRKVDKNRKPIKAESRSIIQSSFSDLDSASHLVAYNNGFVQGTIRAFEQDLHLVLRPDDIWLSILTQFGMYVNAHSEDLRRLFVAHEDKQQLHIDVRPSRVFDLDIGLLSQKMTQLIHQNVVDPELRDWIMPSFTTTTHNDKSVAAVVMMGTLQKYFDFSMRGGCGFPSVTLMGERKDWEGILSRVERLPKYGAEPTEWSKLLIPIIKRMIVSFYLPESQETKDFWLRACHSIGKDGSGSVRSLSGWLTAFCFWNKEGKRINAYSEDDFGTFMDDPPLSKRKVLVLDGVTYPIISPNSIPAGVLSVPVNVEDESTGLLHKTTMVAGSIGVTIAAKSGTRDHESVAWPRSGWWMLEDSVEKLPRASHSERATNSRRKVLGV